MKFAFIINVFREDDFHSGGEKLFYELVNRSIQDCYKVDLYCTTYLGNQTVLKEKLNKLTLLCHPKDFKYPHKIKNFYQQVEELTSKENYDFVISENISPVLKNRSHIGILQGHSLVHYKKTAGGRLGQFLFGLKKSAHIKAQKKWMKTHYRRAVVPSAKLKDELKETFNIEDQKFLVIHPGVDQPDIHASEIKKNEIFTFGLSAPSFSKKGGYIFLKALKLLKERNYNFKARIIYPKYKKNSWLKMLISKYKLKDNIEFIGYQEDMSEFYDSIDCVVMPSLVETFGLVALESMIRSKPAIVSSWSGASEIINDGENGFIFEIEENAPENLAENMENFLKPDTEYEKIAQKAQETAKNYNWENFYNKFKEEILSL